MNCICGYWQEGNFDIYMPGLYVCPRCGTVRAKLKKPIKICRDCEKNGGVAYSNNVGTYVRCTITGNRHGLNDHCDVEGSE